MAEQIIKTKKHSKKHSSKPPAPYGSREEVWKGVAIQTSGGLKKDDLMRSLKGSKIISKKKHEIGKKLLEQNPNHPLRRIKQSEPASGSGDVKTMSIDDEVDSSDNDVAESS